MHGRKKKHKMRIDYGKEECGDITLDYGDETAQPTSEMDVDRLESTAEKNWTTLERPVRENQLAPGTIVGYKTLGINPVTYTPEQLLTVGKVESCDSDTVVVRTLREREQVSFSGPVDDDSVAVQEEERHTWAEIETADWRILT
ncbi:hypothetical protein JVU11DRAFT_1202 [Chiua virens]|nr:hypothetical protein JVU11DRAFT_1202 [Chiua virens]